MSKDHLTLADFQRHIRDRYYATDSARGAPATFLWFVEEVGELATALHKAQGTATPAVMAKAKGGNLAEEFADVLAWLCTLANITGVDLADAVRDKYLESGGPEGHK
ncbi:MAG: hypothetical protein IT441_02225 [Phycisphaeraceae bacterium]|nr:hypothetical protein [Phycisphaeraceae bacterium]